MSELLLGSHYAVASNDVCMPKRVRGLGLPNFKWMNVALRARWLWLRHTDRDMPWAELDIKVPPEATQIYHAAMFVLVGDGKSSDFWLER